MVFEYELQTPRGGFIDITAQVSEAVAKFCEETGRTEASCLVFCPHTTAAVTVNENADPDVQHDLLIALEKAFPDRPEFLHGEGNSAAHAKSSCIGVSEQLIVKGGSLLLGTWQGIYFCEFDGPRRRRFFVRIN